MILLSLCSVREVTITCDLTFDKSVEKPVCAITFLSLDGLAKFGESSSHRGILSATLLDVGQCFGTLFEHRRKQGLVAVLELEVLPVVFPCFEPSVLQSLGKFADVAHSSIDALAKLVHKRILQ